LDICANCKAELDLKNEFQSWMLSHGYCPYCGHFPVVFYHDPTIEQLKGEK